MLYRVCLREPAVFLKFYHEKFNNSLILDTYVHNIHLSGIFRIKLFTANKGLALLVLARRLRRARHYDRIHPIFERPNFSRFKYQSDNLSHYKIHSHSHHK